MCDEGVHACVKKSGIVFVHPYLLAAPPNSSWSDGEGRREQEVVLSAAWQGLVCDVSPVDMALGYGSVHIIGTAFAVGGHAYNCTFYHEGRSDHAAETLAYIDSGKPGSSA